MPKDNLEKSVPLLSALLIAAVAFGCSPRGMEAETSAVDEGVALYIAGEYDRAVEALEALVGDLKSEEDVLTVYLYLGRSYEALGDYQAAAEVFSTGRIAGGGVQFDDHLAAVQARLRTTPRWINIQPRITRAQLAALLVRLGAIGDGGAESGAARIVGDLEGHWAQDYALRVADYGIMEVLPDGGFHPDDAVTAASFYIVLLRAAVALGVPDGALEAHFIGGYRGVLAAEDVFVSGADAVDILQAVMAQRVID